MNIQRLRNLTTGRLHTEIGHVYEDLEIITGEKGLMTHMLPRAAHADHGGALYMHPANRQNSEARKRVQIAASL